MSSYEEDNSETGEIVDKIAGDLGLLKRQYERKISKIIQENKDLKRKICVLHEMIKEKNLEIDICKRDEELRDRKLRKIKEIIDRSNSDDEEEGKDEDREPQKGWGEVQWPQEWWNHSDLIFSQEINLP